MDGARRCHEPPSEPGPAEKWLSIVRRRGRRHGPGWLVTRGPWWAARRDRRPPCRASRRSRRPRRAAGGPSPDRGVRARGDARVAPTPRPTPRPCARSSTAARSRSRSMASSGCGRRACWVWASYAPSSSRVDIVEATVHMRERASGPRSDGARGGLDRPRAAPRPHPEPGRDRGAPSLSQELGLPAPDARRGPSTRACRPTCVWACSHRERGGARRGVATSATRLLAAGVVDSARAHRAADGSLGARAAGRRGARYSRSGARALDAGRCAAPPGPALRAACGVVETIASDVATIQRTAGRLESCLTTTPLAAPAPGAADLVRQSALGELAGVLRALERAIAGAIAKSAAAQVPWTARWRTREELTLQVVLLTTQGMSRRAITRCAWSPVETPFASA